MKKTYILTLILMGIVSVYVLIKQSNSLNLDEGETTPLFQEILKNNEMPFFDGAKYITGNNEKNYIMINNELWRILSINDNNAVKLIKDSKLPDFGRVKYSTKNSNEYQDSVLNELLPEWAEENLSFLGDYLEEDYYCAAYNSTCLSNIELKIGILAENEYKNSFSRGESFLKNSFDWWIISHNSYEDDDYFSAVVDEEGNIVKTDIHDIAGIRPVIVINGNIRVTGKGTIEEPYFINL